MSWPVVFALILFAFGLGFSLGQQTARSRGDRQASLTPHQDPDIEELIRLGRKIEAIRRYRERYGVGLKDAKDAVEMLERQQRGHR